MQYLYAYNAITISFRLYFQRIYIAISTNKGITRQGVTKPTINNQINESGGKLKSQNYNVCYLFVTL